VEHRTEMVIYLDCLCVCVSHIWRLVIGQCGSLRALIGENKFTLERIGTLKKHVNTRLIYYYVAVN
jgi:hypothetical protein